MTTGASGAASDTSQPRRLGPSPTLDGLRGVAIIAVLGTHVIFLDSGSPTWSLRGGFLGVDLFLGLSAFLIGAVLLRELDIRSATEGAPGIDARSFARRRLRRLYPPLMLLLVVSGVVAVVFLDKDAAERIHQSLPVVASLANWQRSWGNPLPFELVHLWSLSLEAQFYLLMALGFWFGRRHLDGRRPVLVLLVASAGVWIWRLWLYDKGVDPADLYEHTGTRADAMLLGVAAAIAWRNRLLADRAVQLLAVVAGAFLVLAMVLTDVDSPWLYQGGFTLVAAASALVVMAAATGPGPVATVGGWAPMRWVGEISYSLYLWHLPIYIWTVNLLGDDAPLLAKAGLAVPASVLAGWLSYSFVERRTLAAWRRGT